MKHISNLIKQNETLTQTSRASWRRDDLETNQVFEILQYYLEDNLRSRFIKHEHINQQQEALMQIAKWYVKDNTGKLNPEKGLLIRGGIGTGKTLIAEAIRDTHFTIMHNVAQFIHSTELTEIFVEKKTEIIEACKQRNLLIVDDVGVEQSEINRFGSKFQPFVEIVDERYRRQKQSVLTSNLNAKMFAEKYGDRIVSRIRETFNDLILKGEDLRK